MFVVVEQGAERFFKAAEYHQRMRSFLASKSLHPNFLISSHLPDGLTPIENSQALKQKRCI
jgi:hypothetical protein